MADTLNLEDIQGIIIRGYGNLTAACYVLLEISDSDSAKSWLASIASTITNGQTRPENDALNIAFTASGLKELGLEPEVLAMFSNEFIDGMAIPHRSRILGDVEESSPEHWIWGGPTSRSIDMVLMLFARNDQELLDKYNMYLKTFPVHGLGEVKKLDTVNLGYVEHFGFHDGISQPVMTGLSESESPMNTIQTGEFLLGYPNEYGLYTERPLMKSIADPRGLLPHDAGGSGNRDLGRNGSYLVFRQLSQDVRGFWTFLDQATKNQDGTSNPTARTRLASKMIGRWPSGAPLVQAPDEDDMKLADSNDFGYQQTDPYGYNCPIGAHIRRVNPRDSLEPQPGTEKSIDVGKRHRILRRGREYGQQIDPRDLFDGNASVREDQDRGLYFICFCANIARQFEFIQHTWANNPHFDGLYEDVDPILGVHSPDRGTFTIQAKPVRKRIVGLPRFIFVRGGAYFFMPGINAVRYLATLGR
ncbi:peroxidase [Dictyobacter sp. S3.2.2.5]|uniref:Peroxidase n=1 Tax=Dictyobacter halimunensis TaxID=3026934 RepID=A0ABQ6FL88_9CHLR|nr:peroxidase [Dictyobacter sp. S3.2.2.5]